MKFRIMCRYFLTKNFNWTQSLFRLCQLCSFHKEDAKSNVHTLQCTLYTVHYTQYRPELSSPEISQGRRHMLDMLL